MFGSSTSFFGGSWRNQDSSALSVSGRLTSACRCFEASQNAPKSRSIVPVGVWRPPGWLLDVFGSATSSSWRILEALGGARSLQNQDSLALSVSGKLTSHDLSCLSVSGGLPECCEVTMCRACGCLEASQGAMSEIGPASAGLRRGFDGPNRWGFGACPSKIFRSLGV